MSAEILVGAYGVDGGLHVHHTLSSIYISRWVSDFQLITDFFGLYGTVTTLREGKYYRLRPTVSRIRDSFESSELQSIRWIPGRENISDSLTKYNHNTRSLLNEVMVKGILEPSIFTGSHVLTSE